MLKRIVLFVVLAMSLALVACAGETVEETEEVPDAPEAEADPVPPEAEETDEEDGEEEMEEEASEEEMTEDEEMAEEPLKLAFVSPDAIGINPFLILGEAGIEQAAEELGAEFEVYEAVFGDLTVTEETLLAAADDGADIVMVLGFEFNDFIPGAAEEYPDTEFLIVDQCIDPLPENVSCAVFREHEAAFLIGATAGLLTETDNVGVITALDTPFFRRYTDGYAEGAAFVNPDVNVEIIFIGGDNPFADPARAKEQALAMAEGDVDQLFGAGAASNPGIYEAAVEQGFQVYATDTNQCPEQPEILVDSLLKRVDVVVVESISRIAAEGGGVVDVYGLEENGIGLVALTVDDVEASECLIANSPEVIEQLEELQQQIIDGEIVVNDPMAP